MSERDDAIGISFVVAGTPVPKGSMRPRLIPGTDDRPARAVATHDNQRTKPWSVLVSWVARDAMRDRTPLNGPLELSVAFYLARPSGHYGARGALRPSAPAYPAVKPDLDKLTRAIGDALEGVCYTQDSRIVRIATSKDYADSVRPGAHVTLRQLTARVGDAAASAAHPPLFPPPEK